MNFQCPEDEKTYVHRVGRTGRAGNTGVAVTFVDWDDIPRWGLINKTLDLGIPEPQETYSSSEHLYTDLDIPREAKGKLPKSAQTRAGLAAEEIEDIEGPSKSSGARGRSAGRGGRSQGGRSQGPREAQRGEPRGARDGAAAEPGSAPRQRRSRNRRRTRGGEAASAPAAD